MPSLIEPEDAAARIVEGLDSKRFEIRFPALFAATLRVLSMLPYSLYLSLIKRITSK